MSDSNVVDLAARQIAKIAADPESAKDDSLLGAVIRIVSAVGRVVLDDAGDAYFHPGGATVIPMPSRAFADVVAAGAAKNSLTIKKSMIEDVATNLRGRALLQKGKRRVHVRIAGDASSIYIHLGGDDVITITGDGWRVESWAGRADPPVVFVEPGNYLPLPKPAKGGDIRELRKLLNVSDESFALICMWLVAALRPDASYPILTINGPKGAAKTTTTKLLRSLIDPSAVPHRSPPRSEQDLAIAGSKTLVLAFDNLSRVSEGLSDWLCRIATGGGSAQRTLHTNADETTFHLRRPVIMNGIPDLAERADLGSRSYMVRLDIPRARLTDREITTAFAEVAPRVLGALCDAVASALRDVASVPTPEHRMADAAAWALACESTLGFEGGAFANALAENARALEEVARDASPVGEALELFAEGLTQSWEGRATDLDRELRVLLAARMSPAGKDWPVGAAALGREVRRVAPDLAIAHVEEVSIGRGAAKRHGLRITKR